MKIWDSQSITLCILFFFFFFFYNLDETKMIETCTRNLHYVYDLFTMIAYKFQENSSNSSISYFEK